MVSNRQKEARKRFNEERGFPQTPKSTDDSKGEKKKAKPKKTEDKHGRFTKLKGKSKSSVKHPLRVPGMKPGESCFICKEKDHIAKNCPTKATWERKKICLLCRERGHTLKNCPNHFGFEEKKKCYNCGEFGHSLSKCPQPLQSDGTKFAECFICKKQGHLSKSCPENRHGIYVKGGCCKVCGGLTHLAKDCPNKQIGGTGMEARQRSNGLLNVTQARRTVFSSGDDLEDDFTVEEPEEKKGKGVPSVDHSKMKKHVHKVVNFAG